MSDDVKLNKLFFACGAHYNVKPDIILQRKKNGSHIPYRVFGSANAPKLDDKAMPCLMACPARVKDSKRKQSRGWDCDENGEPLHSEPKLTVTCVPVRFEVTQ